MKYNNNLQKYYILGIKLHALNRDILYNLIVNNIHNKIFDFVTFRDVASLMKIKNDHELLNIQNNQVTISCPDGWPLSFIGKLKYNLTYLSQTTGPDFFSFFMRNSNDIKHYLLGSTLDNLNLLKNKVSTNVKIVGISSPFYDEMNDESFKNLSKLINHSKADIVWVAISSPKQELLISKLKNLTNCTFLAVGAALEFYTGKQKRAPSIIRKIRLEWLFRLVSSPRRLWHRYLVLAPMFCILIFIDTLKELFSKKNVS